MKKKGGVGWGGCSVEPAGLIVSTGSFSAVEGLGFSASAFLIKNKIVGCRIPRRSLHVPPTSGAEVP